jgi:hypothetical protein
VGTPENGDKIMDYDQEKLIEIQEGQEIVIKEPYREPRQVRRLSRTTSRILSS